MKKTRLKTIDRILEIIGKSHTIGNRTGDTGNIQCGPGIQRDQICCAL